MNQEDTKTNKKMLVWILHGPNGVGKDTLGRHLANTQSRCVAFADKLRQVVSLLTGIPIHIFEERSSKDTKIAQIEGFSTSSLGKYTPRELLQLIGTDIIRRGMGQYFNIKSTWARATIPVLNKYADNTIVMPFAQNWSGALCDMTITDLRFPDELETVADWARSRGDISICVLFLSRSGVLYPDDHPTARDIRPELRATCQKVGCRLIDVELANMPAADEEKMSEYYCNLVESLREQMRTE